MSNGKKYYCFCSSNCKYETMTKEQILAAIAQAVETGSVGNCDTGFITKVKETNGGGYVSVWVGTQAQYNALPSVEVNCLYIITDDMAGADLEKMLADMQQAINESNESAADAKAMAMDAMSQTEQVDISEDVSLSWSASVGSGEDLDFLSISEKAFVYSRAAGVVFFTFKFTYEGKMSKGESLVFNHLGAYKPALKNRLLHAVTCDQPRFSALYGEDTLLIIANEAFESAQRDVYFSGWYFCDGE